jgi:hypothetical protein
VFVFGALLSVGESVAADGSSVALVEGGSSVDCVVISDSEEVCSERGSSRSGGSRGRSVP